MVKHTGPLLGYNNNVPYKGAVYHVQTEDSGSRRPHVITHLFADGGRIVKTKKTSYAKFVGAESHAERVRTLMRNQHKEMVLKLRGGKFDYLIEPEEGADPRELAKDMVETAELSEDVSLEATGAPSDDRDFQREMEALAGEEGGADGAKGAAAGKRAEKAAREAREAASSEASSSKAPAKSSKAPPKSSVAPPDAEDEEKETTYKFVGRNSPPSKKRSSGSPQRSVPPGRSTPPPARRGGGALPLKKRARSDSSVDAGVFGSRYSTDRRFDELVTTFFERG